MNQGLGRGDRDGQDVRGPSHFQPISPGDGDGNGDGDGGPGSGQLQQHQHHQPDSAPTTSAPVQQHQHHQPNLAPTTSSPARRVDHTYRDYSTFPLSELRPAKKAPTNFPSKLHQILSNPSYSHIISWMPHGRAWKIHNKELLVRDVISKYFVQSKYESFTRQLNGWGFKRLHQSGNDYNAYYHPCFLRGLSHLTVLLDRVKPNQGKQIPHVEGEPNFYEIEKQYPLPPSSAPMMPYHGHYPYPYSSQPTNAAGYGAPPGLPGPPPPPPEPPAGYYNHYPPYYSHPPPYYGHPGDANAAASTYASQSNYPPYHYDPAPYSQPPPHHYLRPSDPPPYAPSQPQHYYSHPHNLGPPGHPFPTLPERGDAPESNDMAPVRSEEVHSLNQSPQISVQEGRLPVEGKSEESGREDQQNKRVNDFGKI